MKALITGGLGFIGLHLYEELKKEDWEIDIIDRDVVKKLKNLTLHGDTRICSADLNNFEYLNKIVNQKNYDIVFHLAGNPDVGADAQTSFNDNIVSTFNLLKALKNQNPIIVFSSSSTIYGQPKTIPTPENYSPLIPLSLYGSAKLACESMLSAKNIGNHRTLILRFANVVGPKMKRGVIKAFIGKIKADPSKLTIMGNGKQDKSYIHVSDCVGAIAHLSKLFLNNDKELDFYNVGTPDKITVNEIAKIVASSMGSKNIEFSYVEDNRGGGDATIMQLSIQKLLDSGFSPLYNSRQSIVSATNQLLGE